MTSQILNGDAHLDNMLNFGGSLKPGMSPRKKIHEIYEGGQDTLFPMSGLFDFSSGATNLYGGHVHAAPLGGNGSSNFM